MAINQSQSKILRICLFVALLVAFADAASLRGSNEIEEVVEDSEEDFYHMIVDEPFETKNEEEPGFYETYVEPLFKAHGAPEDEVDTGRELQLQQRSWWNPWRWGRSRTVQTPVRTPIIVQPQPQLQYFAGGGGGGGGGGIPLRSQLQPQPFQPRDFQRTNFRPASVGYPNYRQPVGINSPPSFNQWFGVAQPGVPGYYNGPRESMFYSVGNVRPVSYFQPAPSTNAQGVEYATGNFAKTPSNGYFDNLSF